MNKVLLYQNYSSNNQKLVGLTIDNHTKYCAKWGYDYLLEPKTYSPFMDFTRIDGLLKSYDTVITIGADCVFTNFKRNLSDYAKNYVNICEEGSDATHVNGEILLFNNKHDGQVFRKLKVMDKAQGIQSSLENQYGFQSVCDRNWEKWSKFLTVIPIYEKIQGFDPSAPNTHVHNPWSALHIMMHCLAGDLENKCERVSGLIDAFKNAGREI